MVSIEGEQWCRRTYEVGCAAEKTFRALKEELIAFMSAGPPTNAAVRHQHCCEHC